MRIKKRFHIVQGGVENGDKAWLQKAAARRLKSSPTWVVPKTSAVGDDVVVYIGGLGFFATARIDTAPKPRLNWRNRYGATLADVRLIAPAISLATIQRRLPALSWAKYPRAITTPSAKVAAQVAALIQERRRTRTPDLSPEALDVASIDELRAVALLKSVSSVSTRTSARVERARAQAIRLYVLRRADGVCEGCRTQAPFLRVDGSPYLEPHHVRRLADDGPDHPTKVIALCPNCHRRVHHGLDGKSFNSGLLGKLRKIEAAASM